MKSNKIWTIISLVILALQIAAEAWAAAVVLRLNLLPQKFIIVLIIALLLLVLITAALLFIHAKKPVSKPRRIVAWVLALLIICGCAVATKLAADAYDALHSVTQDPMETDELSMYVFVRLEDPAKVLTDVKDYTFAVPQDRDPVYTENAITAIESLLGGSISITQYEMTVDSVDALFTENAGVLILDGVGVALLTEEEEYEDFLDKVRILHAIPIADLEETESTTEPTTEPTVPPEPGDIRLTPFIMYISGSDTRSTKLKRSRSDVNILVVVNPVSKQILLVNTPRDYYVPNPAGKGKLDKLTHCGIYGTSCSVEALEGLYDTKIQYYAQINFTGFETLVDAVGGITVYSDKAFSNIDVEIQKGENFLNGKEALGFARDRKHVSGGDNGRGRNQMKVVTALIEKMTSGTTIISNYSAILASLKGMFKTSIDMDDVSKLVKMQLTDMASWNIKSFAVTGTGGKATTYSSPRFNAYVMYPNEKVVAYASELIERVLAGETLTAEDMKVPGKK